MNLNIAIILGLLKAAIALPPVHELMTHEERMEIFHTNELPVYEVIPISISKLHKRNSESRQITVTMRAFDNNITLLCDKNEGTFAGKSTPIYTVNKKFNMMTIKKLTEVGEIELYENLPAGASFTICKSGNLKKINGIIRSQQFAIRSLPDRIVHNITKHRRSINNILHNEENNHQYYLAIKIPQLSNINYNDRKRIVRDIAKTSSIIYPEILIILDYDLYEKLHRNKTNAVVPYVLSFWHAVDLIYRNFAEPEIKLNIAGIVIAKQPNALDYLFENKIQQGNKLNLNVNQALGAMGKWLYNHKTNISLNSYDIAFTMTPNKLCFHNCGNPINGLSYTSKACDINVKKRETLKVGIILNKGAYDRIDTAAHELAHLLGAGHDENSDKCYHSQFMMTESGGSRNSANWSMCSLESIATFVRTKEAMCLYNKPNPGEIVPVCLPGSLMNADEQCKMLGYIKSCKGSKKYGGMCVKLQCLRLYRSKKSCKNINSPAATGTICGEGKICFQMKCIDKHNLKC